MPLTLRPGGNRSQETNNVSCSVGGLSIDEDVGQAQSHITMINNSIVTEFVLFGFPDILSVQIALFYVFLLLYVLTITGNVLIIVATSSSTELRTPMYFFLSNLSFLEIFYTSVTIPKMLLNFIQKSTSISFMACAVQVYFFVALGGIECSLLAIMAYDRYAAICNPLHYVTIMDSATCIGLVFSSWTTGLINSVVHTTCVFHQNFCSSNIVNQFFCDIRPLLSLACDSTLSTEIVLSVVGGIYGVGSFVLTLISYTHIISTILKIQTKKGQQKAFSTCASHVIVVSLFYGTSLFSYARRNSVHITDQEKLTPVIYAVITPTLNPLIYTLRNKEFKMVLTRLMQRRSTKWGYLNENKQNIYLGSAKLK
ncbi:olfactory receptor 5AR1-like [Hyperolius riggenbachi]|uniref:olfactory receptor 5AR1-like n=1 Tax=Hyperolius riggenbachi TaxID=752182 RepID=UPI0035A33A9B